MAEEIFELIERQIRKAELEGQFRDLPGAGKPLPELDGSLGPAEQLANRMLRESGTVPPEVQLRQAVEKARKRLKTLPDGDARKAAMKELADAELRLSLALEARSRFIGR